MNFHFKKFSFLFYLQKKTLELKQNATIDNTLLKKSSLDIPLVPETEEDKKIASLLSQKLKPKESIEKSSELARKRVIMTSSLPTSSFTPVKEKKALRLLKTDVKISGIVKKPNPLLTNVTESKKIKLSNSLVDYGVSSSDSD